MSDKERCARCNVELVDGQALVNVATAGAPDFIGSREPVTYSMGSDAQLVNVLKCPKCGHSWRITGDNPSDERP